MSQVQQQPSSTYEAYIRATPEQIWEALTNPEFTQQYYYYTRAESDWQQGSTVKWLNQEGNADVSGTIVEAQAPTRLVTTFVPAWAPPAEGASADIVSYDIQSFGEVTKLTLTHNGLDRSNPESIGVHEGWVQIVSSLKSLLETGQATPLIFG